MGERRGQGKVGVGFCLLVEIDLDLGRKYLRSLLQQIPRPAVVSSLLNRHRGREGFSSLLEGESGVEATLLYVYSTDFFTWTPEGRSY